MFICIMRVSKWLMRWKQGNTRSALAVAQSAIHIEPTRSVSRREVAALAIQNGEYNSALALLRSSETNECSESLCLRAIAGSFNIRDPSPTADSPQTLLRLAQKAVMLSPSQVRNWETLAFVRKRVAQ
jgi:superkiller protein 3